MSFSFGLALPVFVLEQDSAPPYRFISKLGGKQEFEEFSKPGVVPITKKVKYAFETPAVFVLESAQKELKPPDWTFYPKFFAFRHKNGDSGRIMPLHDRCTLDITYALTDFEDLWARIRLSMGL